jgi:hypothetical protein
MLGEPENQFSLTRAALRACGAQKQIPIRLAKQIVFSGTAALCLVQHAVAFEGRITATLTQAGEAKNFLYTAGTNLLRIERIETNRPYARNVVNRDSGAITLLFPYNRSFMRWKPAPQNASPFPGAPVLPPGIGPQARPLPAAPAGIGPTNLPGMPAPTATPPMPAMPQMPLGLPPGIGPQPGGAPGAPTLPRMPLARIFP